MAVIYTSPVVTKNRKDNSSNGKLNYYVTADLQSQDAVNNTSTVLFTVWMAYSTSSTGVLWSTSYPPYMKLTVDGTTYDPTSNIDVGTSSSNTYITGGKIRKYYKSQTYLAVHKKELTITHDTDGTKSVAISYTWVPSTSSSVNGYMPTAFTAPSSSTTYTVTLPPLGGYMSKKVSGEWKDGIAWIKVNDAWKKSKEVYIKVNGTWQKAKSN